MQTNPSTNRSFGVLVLFLVVCLIVSGIGGSVTAGSEDTWYQTLAKPAFAPPDWIFAPVWTVLYLAIAVAGWRIWLQLGWRDGRGPLALWGMQLLLNLYWPLIFFGLQAVAAAFVWILILLGAIFACIKVFAGIDRAAALLFVPYAIWVAYASVLNGAIWYLN
ncbi:TspO protein [Alkalilimnicola ehrlichii]|uniref:TspO protein n=1 Tax=Alkalilimnicola ehrlichii TaxID=351052 RepID=A0A3E0WSV8_9GAMM|nr:TspO/MBR family protein [Alkalilimnicola ehrlichii]RFA29150.1 TspO protein [Alkalilimnicola ehrlichii]RFA36062.1 TspO protein [Alkalilimnicola ehrlichii]